MAEKRRLFLTGSERAEFEHIFGPLTVDQTDSRFVLVDEELEQKIAALPPGVPVRQGQHPRDLAAIRAAELEAWGLEGEDGSSVQGGKGAVEAEHLDVDTSVEFGDAEEPSGSGEANESVAESGSRPDAKPVKPAASRSKSK